jgi:hypothetical protein
MEVDILWLNCLAMAWTQGVFVRACRARACGNCSMKSAVKRNAKCTSRCQSLSLLHLLPQKHSTAHTKSRLSSRMSCAQLSAVHRSPFAVAKALALQSLARPMLQALWLCRCLSNSARWTGSVFGDMLSVVGQGRKRFPGDATWCITSKSPEGSLMIFTL